MCNSELVEVKNAMESLSVSGVVRPRVCARSIAKCSLAHWAPVPSEMEDKGMDMDVWHWHSPVPGRCPDIHRNVCLDLVILQQVMIVQMNQQTLTKCRCSSSRNLWKVQKETQGFHFPHEPRVWNSAIGVKQCNRI